jgi:hypothetical protein
MVWHNKGEYIGQFLNGEKSGQGVWEASNGEHYEGEWKNNVKEGKNKEN